MNRILQIIMVSVLMVSCTVAPQEIAYGQDGCHFCKMTIVDRQHSAQVVTVKGKSYKYDAIECMMNHRKKWDGPEIKYFLVSDYETPGVLIDATKAEYLISEAIPSPMGEFLTAFSKESDRDNMLNEVGGQALSWIELSKEFGLEK